MDITAGILAGGKSSRMGCNKALLPHGQENFLEHMVSALHDFDEVLISVDDPAHWGALPCAAVADELTGFGPVEGIYQLLRRASHPYLLVVATDMQHITADFLRDFTARLRPEDKCMVLCDGDLLEPLCSVYHKDLLPLLEQLRREGICRPRALFSHVPVHYVRLDELGYGPEIVANINTRQDYAALLESERQES